MKWLFILLILKFLIVHSQNDTTAYSDEEATEIDDANIYVDILLSDLIATNRSHSLNNNLTPTKLHKQRTFDESDGPDFHALYSFGLYTDYSHVLTSQLVENYIQLAILRYFDCVSRSVEVRLLSGNGLWRERPTRVTFSPVQISLTSEFNITSANVSNALIDFAANGRACFVNETTGSIECSGGRAKDVESLLYFSDFWVRLDNSAGAFQRVSKSYVLRSDGFDRGDASFLGMGWTVFFTTLIIILGIVVFAFLAIYVYATKLYRIKDKVFPFTQSPGGSLHSPADVHVVTMNDINETISSETTNNTPPKKPKDAYY